MVMRYRLYCTSCCRCVVCTSSVYVSAGRRCMWRSSEVQAGKVQAGKVVHPGSAGSGAKSQIRVGRRSEGSVLQSIDPCLPWRFATTPLTTTTHYALLSRNQRPLPPLFVGPCEWCLVAAAREAGLVLCIATRPLIHPAISVCLARSLAGLLVHHLWLQCRLTACAPFGD